MTQTKSNAERFLIAFTTLENEMNRRIKSDRYVSYSELVRRMSKIDRNYQRFQKHLEECGFEDVGGDFTYIPNDLKEVTPEQRETLDKMIERLEEFDDVQTVYTNMKPEEGEE